MTAEEIKAALREYAESQHGERWRTASAMVDFRPPDPPETLVVFRDDKADDQANPKAA